MAIEDQKSVKKGADNKYYFISDIGGEHECLKCKESKENPRIFKMPQGGEIIYGGD